MKKRHTIGAIAGIVIIVGVIDIYRGRLEAAKKGLPWGHANRRRKRRHSPLKRPAPRQKHPGTEAPSLICAAITAKLGHKPAPFAVVTREKTARQQKRQSPRHPRDGDACFRFRLHATTPIGTKAVTAANRWTSPRAPWMCPSPSGLSSGTKSKKAVRLTQA